MDGAGPTLILQMWKRRIINLVFPLNTNTNTSARRLTVAHLRLASMGFESEQAGAYHWLHVAP